MALFADLDNPASFRDLSKPIGALNDERLARMRVSNGPFKGHEYTSMIFPSLLQWGTTLVTSCLLLWRV